MSDNKDKEDVLAGEKLITDFFLETPKPTKLTEFQKFLWDQTLRDAVELRDLILEHNNPDAGDIIFACRKIINFGISQKGIATWFGVNTGTVSRWVSGESPPREFMRGPILNELGEIVGYVIKRLESYATDRPDLGLKPPRRGSARRDGPQRPSRQGSYQGFKVVKP